MKKNKILLCHVVTSLGVGGMENGIVNLANNHNRDRFEIVVCCLNTAGAMAERLKDDVRLYVLGEGEGFSLSRILRVAKFFRKLRPDIVHTHGWGGGSLYGILGAKLANIPVVINGEHGTFFTQKKQILLQKALFKLCDYNLAVSETLRERVANILSVSPCDITVLKNGVDTKKFSGNCPKEKIIQQLNDEGYPVDISSFNIFMIGSLKPIKAHHILLKAVGDLSKDNELINVRIFFVGDGAEKPRLDKEARQLGIKQHVYFLGKRNDVPQLLSIAHVLVSASVSEGLSNVILEAMSSGVSVIATNTGSEEIVVHGENGFLFEKGDYVALGEYLLILMHNRDQLKKLACNAQELIIAEYTIFRMVQNYEELYIHALEF